MRQSLPSRERGLKYGGQRFGLSSSGVAPFTGAWIEIRRFSPQRTSFSVAPFTGAWIEIMKYLLHICRIRSLPSRERGLKSACRWYGQGRRRSLPSRERGLKSVLCGRPWPTSRSLPSRERGLKYALLFDSILDAGRSLHGSVD